VSRRIEPLVAVFVDMRYDNTDDGRRFRRVLEARGYTLTCREAPFGHDWNNWGPLLPEVLETFFGQN
jgi:enterochelin esterase-like enzyme